MDFDYYVNVYMTSLFCGKALGPDNCTEGVYSAFLSETKIARVRQIERSRDTFRMLKGEIVTIYIDK